MKMHIGAKSLREAMTVFFSQGANASLPTLVTNFTAFVSPPMIKAHFGMSRSHELSPFLRPPYCFGRLCKCSIGRRLDGPKISLAPVEIVRDSRHISYDINQFINVVWHME
jgi:hypothetical protein